MAQVSLANNTDDASQYLAKLLRTTSSGIVRSVVDSAKDNTPNNYTVDVPAEYRAGSAVLPGKLCRLRPAQAGGRAIGRGSDPTPKSSTQANYYDGLVVSSLNFGDGFSYDHRTDKYYYVRAVRAF